MKLKGVYKTKKQNEHLDEVLALREKGFSVRAIEKKTGVSKATVSIWIANFAKVTDPIECSMEDQPQSQPCSSNDSNEGLSLEEQVAKLKEALRMAELRADAYDEMINVAEAKFNVPIRKKAGTKQ